MAPKTTFICPFCFETVKLTDAEFRCTNKRCKDFDDIPVTKYENGNLQNPKKGKKTFRSPSKNPYSIPKSAICPEPDCKQKTYKIVCPRCHNTLPESTLTGNDMIISVVGSRDSGKSHFVGVIINELIERISVAFDGAMVGFDDTMSRYESSFRRKLYVDLQKLELTQSSTQNINNDAYRPLIFTLNLKHKSMFKESIDCFTFVFFDTAGEDLNDEDTMSTVNKYICKSAGIIFLHDPMQIPYVYNTLDDDTVKRSKTVSTNATRSDDIMARVSRLIRNDKKMSSTEMIDIPVAVVFSKFDAVTPIIPQGSVILENSPHCSEKKFCETDFHNVNSEIEALLKAWGESDGSASFMSQVNVNYKNYAYFGISALGLGNNPRTDRGIERPRPHRIEDPLLWIMKEKNVIKVKK